MPAPCSDISDRLTFLILPESTKENENTDFIIMDEFHVINNALAINPTSHLSITNGRVSRLDSCQSPDQFFVSMVNEFLNDNDDTTVEGVAKTSSLNIEYLEEPTDNEVDSLINFHHIKEFENAIATSSSTSSSSSSSSPSLSSSLSLPLQTVSATALTSVSASASALASASVSSASTSASASLSASASASPSPSPSFQINHSTEDTKDINSPLLSQLRENLPLNIKEISYQRFGRFNTNLPAEVHNFKCHLCSFSCAWKEILLQHFQDKHPT